MTANGDDELVELMELWRARGASVTALFEELRDPMRQAARSGLRRILARAPNEDDVDDAVFTAFKVVLRKDPAEIKHSILGFARTVAYRRGMDKARTIIREREQVKSQAWQLNPLLVTAEDEARGADRDELLRRALDCMGSLTEPQRDVIQATLQRQESLSDWTARRGKSYEAGRRMLERGLASLRRCIEAKRKAELEEES